MTDQEIKDKVQSLVDKQEYSSDMDGGEMQDVVDSNDLVIGTMPRGVIWDNGLENNTRVVNIFVQNEKGEVLLPVRSRKKRYLPGGYDYSCGENLQSGEDYFSAAIRGLKEELGIENEKLVKRGSFSPNKLKTTFCFGRAYLCVIDTKRFFLKPNEDEVERYEWKSLEEIEQMLKVEQSKFKRDYKSIFELVFNS